MEKKLKIKAPHQENSRTKKMKKVFCLHSRNNLLTFDKLNSTLD